MGQVRQCSKGFYNRDPECSTFSWDNWKVQMDVTCFSVFFFPPPSSVWTLLINCSLSCHSWVIANSWRRAPLASCVPFINAHIEFFSPLLSPAPLLTDDRQETALNLSTNGISSINMSIEINGVVYTGK